MLGAIVGNIVGSVYEFDNHKSKDFPLFRVVGAGVSLLPYYIAQAHLDDE